MDTTSTSTLSDSQLDWLIDQLSRRPGTMAWHLFGTGIVPGTLSLNTGCSVDTYRRLALCGLPRDEADIPVIAAHHGIRPERLAQLFAFCEVPFIGRTSEPSR